jgi:hypothetical protein
MDTVEEILNAIAQEPGQEAADALAKAFGLSDAHKAARNELKRVANALKGEPSDGIDPP